jgi:hypothetical protein
MTRGSWERIIQEKMEAMELIAGEGSSIYKVRGEKTTVWVITELGDFPPPFPPLDKFEVGPSGGRELSFDVSDPDFLVITKTIGVAETTHYIPWVRIVDIVFRTRS